MDLLTTGLEVAGLVLIVVGVWMVFVPAALMVAGIGLIALSFGASRGER
jgi:hypothetical protein